MLREGSIKFFSDNSMEPPFTHLDHLQKQVWSVEEIASTI